MRTRVSGDLSRYFCGARSLAGGRPLAPGKKLWQESLISSRLLEYKIWTRIHAETPANTRKRDALLVGAYGIGRTLLPVLVRALEPFPKRVRILDALHLASIDFLFRQGQSVALTAV